MARAKKSAKAPKAKAGFFTIVLILALLTALGVQLHSLRRQVDQAQAQQETLALQVAQQQQENDALQERIDSGGSEEEMKEIARAELGLVEPNEKVFYDTSN